MACSDAQLRANRANALKSTGPKTPEGQRVAAANATTHGLCSIGKALPAELATLVEQRRREFDADFQPRSPVERELVFQLALASVQCVRAIFLEFELEAVHRELNIANWNHDLLLRAATWGAKLADQPERATRELERFSAGCEWLRLRWLALHTALTDTTCSWTEAEVSRVLDLLGIPKLDRDRAPRAQELIENVKAAQAGETAALKALQEMVNAQLATLSRSAERLRTGPEQRQYEALCAGLWFDTSPALNQLRRHGAAATRRFQTILAELKRLGLGPRPRPHALPHAPAPTPPPPPPPPPPRERAPVPPRERDRGAAPASPPPPPTAPAPAPASAPIPTYVPITSPLYKIYHAKPKNSLDYIIFEEPNVHRDLMSILPPAPLPSTAAATAFPPPR
jgi:hypothetical protein